MKSAGFGTFGRAAAAVILVGALGAVPLQGQRVSADCRCVDRDGNEIENCTCLTTPRPDDFMAGVLAERAPRARIGVSVDPNQRARVDERGVRVTSVMQGGPADEAGLRRGDVITRIDGRSVFEPLDADVERDFDLDDSIPVQRLLAIARELEPDVEVEVEFLRDEEERTVTLETSNLTSWGSGGAFSVLVPGWAPDRPEAGFDELFGRMDDLRKRRSWAPDGGVTVWRDRDRGDVRVERVGPGAAVLALGSQGRFEHCPGADDPRVLAFGGGCVGGLELVELNPELGTYFGATEGVLVTDVHPDSPVGLEAGDVILEVGDRAAESPDRVRRILRSYEREEAVRFRILRDGEEMSVSGYLTR